MREMRDPGCRAELEALSLAITEADPRWNRQPGQHEPEQLPPHNVG
jgi:hypothetical protein